MRISGLIWDSFEESSDLRLRMISPVKLLLKKNQLLVGSTEAKQI